MDIVSAFSSSQGRMDQDPNRKLANEIITACRKEMRSISTSNENEQHLNELLDG